MSEINIEEIKSKLIEKLVPAGWADMLKGYLRSSDFDLVLSTLIKDSNEGNKFTPPLKNIFRTFEMCKIKDLKVVMVGQDPYPQLGVADGVAFSCSITNKPEKSLIYILDAIERTVFPEGIIPNYNLDYLSKQGVLMLNTALTTRVGQVGAHYLIWKPFMAYLMDRLSTQYPGLVYVFMGRKSQEWSSSIPNSNPKMFITHPASAAYKGQKTWDCDNIFNRVNNELMAMNGNSINWARSAYEKC